MGVKRGRGDRVSSDTTYHKSLGSQQLTPAKFRRQLKTTVLTGPAPADFRFPTGLEGHQVFVDLRQNTGQYEGATLQTVEEELLSIDALRSYRRTDDAQTETIDERLVLETDPPPQLSALVTTMQQDALGDGKSLLRYGTVPTVFPNQRWEVNRPLVTPEIFRALIPTQSYTFTEAGIAGPIPLPLPLGVTEAFDEQIDVYKHRKKTGSLDLGILPVTIIGSRTTKDKQVEHIEKTLQVDSQAPAPPTALLDVTWTKLGDGTAVEEHDFVDFLFTQETYEKEITDVIPHKFKALVPIQTASAVSVGTAGPPVMLDGDLKRTSEQTNVFVVKNTRQYRDVTVLPVQLIDYKLTGKLQVSTVTNRIALGLQTITPDYTFIDASVENLGNNTSVRSIEAIAPADFYEDRSYERQIPDLIPEKYRPVTPTKRQSHLEPGVAADRNLVTGELAFTSEQVNAFVRKETSQFRDTTSLPQSLTDYELNREKQVVTLIGTLNTGLQTLTGINELTDSAKVDNLGNNLSLKTVGTVPLLFDAESFGKTIPDIIPEKFRVVVPTTRHEELVADTSANDRALATGELSYTSERVNAFVVKETSTGRDAASLPVSLPGYRMTAQGQVADITARLATGLQTITPDFTYIEAEVENLGNNLSLKTTATIPNAAFPLTSVFPEDTWTTSIINLIPEKLRAAIPIVEVTIDSKIPPDVDTSYTLIAGELEHTEKRIGVFKKRTSSKMMGAITLPVIKTDHGITEQNGGGTTTITHTLNTHGSIPVEAGLDILKSETIDLGNGYDVRTTERVSGLPWPLLSGQDYDERLNIILPFTTQTRPAGTSLGSPRKDIKPRDLWKQDERTVDISTVAEVLDDYVLQYPSKVNIDMPDKLVALQGIIETAFGEGANSEDGSISVSGSFSVNMSLRAAAQSSASMIPDVAPDIVQFWGNQLDCMHYQFFLPTTPTITPAILAAKITALVGTSVSNWPKFAPKSVTIAARGEKASVQATASSQGSAAQSTSGSSSTTAGGTGYSKEHSLNLKTIRVSPTIHGALTVNSPTSDSFNINVSASAEASGLGPFESSSQSDSVAASITPTSIPASAGDTDWPTSGKYLYKVDAQPYRYGYVQFHVIVVDASDFPSS